MKTVYFDHASTTSLEPKVLEKMMPYLTSYYGNANSLHSIGRQAVNGLDEARDIIAQIIGADFNEVYFTSGGTEGDNWAVRGTYDKRGTKNKIVTSSIEHSAMLNTISNLKGVTVEKIKPNELGFVSVNDYFEKVDENTFLTTLMFANNEVGTIEPVKEVAKIAHEKGSLFFTDAVQAVGAIDFKVKDLGVDMLSCSAHKFGGPKGVGFLYVKNGTEVSSIISGGHQERAMRGGTSNVAGAIGLAYALKFNRENLKENNEKITSLRNYFIDEVLKVIPFAKLNGDRNLRLPNNANILFKGINGETLNTKLDLNGYCASLGAACSAGSIEPSHVLTEMGLSGKDAFSSIRFTFGKENTYEEIDGFVKTLKQILEELK